MEGMKNGVEKNIMEPEYILTHMEEIGKQFAENAINVRAMIEEAKERNIPIDLSNSLILEKFALDGEYEITINKLSAEMARIGSELLDQGVRMTQEELKNRKEKMEK